MFGLREPRKERQDLGRRATLLRLGLLLRQDFAQVICGFADFALTGQEDKDVARAVAPQLVHGLRDGVIQVVIALLFEGPPTLFNGEQTARNHDDGRRPLARRKVLGKTISVDGGRGDDDFQVRPARQDLPQVTEQKIDVQTALMGLVNDDRVVGLQQRVGLCFSQQDAIGHQLDRSTALKAILKAHLVAHHFAQRRLQFVGNALGHTGRSDAPGLGVTDEPAPTRTYAAAKLQNDLRQLRGLARTRFATDDDHLVRGNGARDVVTPSRDRQRFWVVDGRDRVARRGDARRHGARIMSGRARRAAGFKTCCRSSH